MRIVTLNLWHGMAPGVGYSFHSLEPSFRRQQRETLQREWLQSAKADIVILQEANPVHERAIDLAEVTGMQSFFQPDLSGIKIAGFGWPHNLTNGLITLVKPELQPRLVDSWQLSGPKSSFANRFGSFQLGECRFALAVEFMHREFGRGLIVNCHLHHELEIDGVIRDKIQALSDQGQITSAAAGELRTRLEVANTRRQSEVKVLLEHLEFMKNRYSFILVGGDLNTSPRSQVYNELVRFGFEDLWLSGKKSEEQGYTFDAVANSATHRFSSDYPIRIETDDLSFSPKARDMLKSLLQEHEGRPRRIDYLMAMSGQRKLEVNSIELAGLPKGDQLALSDHFALKAELK